MRVELSGHRIDLAVASDLPLVEVDPRLFHHILINLLDNAAKYGAADGAIRVAAGRRADGLDLMIEDEGPGIPEGEEARIFETFLRADGSDRTGGSGLGLAIVRGFAEAMGLRVTASNRADRSGARFTIAFDDDRLIRLPTSALA